MLFERRFAFYGAGPPHFVLPGKTDDIYALMC